MARKRRRARRTTTRRRVPTIAVRKKCKSFRIRCGKRVVQCHVGRKHRGGIYCRKVKVKKGKK